MANDVPMLAGFDELLAMLTRDEVPHLAHPEQKMVELRTSRDTLQGSLVIRWHAEGGVILLVQSLPFEIGQGHEGALATAMLDLNHGLVIGTFGFSSTERRPYLRITLTLRQGAAPANEVKAAIKSLVGSAARYLPQLQAIGTGEA